MKIVVLADVHGNMEAVEALEKELERIQPDDVWFLGDAVGKGPESDKAIDWVREHCFHWIAGNWDRVLTMYPDYNAYYIRQIGPERHAWLESLPLEDELEISGIRFRLVHGPGQRQGIRRGRLRQEPGLRAGFRFPASCAPGSERHLAGRRCRRPLLPHPLHRPPPGLQEAVWVLVEATICRSERPFQKIDCQVDTRMLVGRGLYYCLSGDSFSGRKRVNLININPLKH